MMTETNAKPIEPTCSMCPSYPRIQAELSRLTAALAEEEAECERRGKELLAIHMALKDNVNDPDPLPSSPHCASYPTTYGLVMGITRERDKWKSLAASRLADQEAIERHTRRVVAGECAEIAETFRTPYGTHPLLSGVQIGAVIRKKYGVE